MNNMELVQEQNYKVVAISPYFLKDHTMYFKRLFLWTIQTVIALASTITGSQTDDEKFVEQKSKCFQTTHNPSMYMRTSFKVKAPPTAQPETLGSVYCPVTGIRDNLACQPDCVEISGLFHF